MSAFDRHRQLPELEVLSAVSRLVESRSVAVVGNATEIIVVRSTRPGDGRLPGVRRRCIPGVRFVQNDGNWGFADGCNRVPPRHTVSSCLFLNPDAEDPGGRIVGALRRRRARIPTRRS